MLTLFLPSPVADNGELGNRLESFLKSYIGRAGDFFVSYFLWLFSGFVEGGVVFVFLGFF